MSITDEAKQQINELGLCISEKDCEAIGEIIETCYAIGKWHGYADGRRHAIEQQNNELRAIR